MRDKAHEENGFTLIELLVALLVSSFLLIILFDGLANAAQRSAQQKQSEQALILAQKVLAEPIGDFKVDAMVWDVKEDVIARDPRGNQILVKREVTVMDDERLPLISLEKRLVKSAK